MIAISPTAAGLPERLRYLGYFGQHAAFAAALRAVPFSGRARDKRAVDGRLSVGFLSAYPPSHYGTVSRFARWLPHLESEGIDATVLTPASDEEYAGFESGDPAATGSYIRACLAGTWRNIRRARAFDVVVLHRGLMPFSPWQRPTFERLLARANDRLVYDFYDAIWLQRHQAHTAADSSLARWLHPPDKIEQLMGLARVVTVSNETLAEFARPHHPDVRVIPMLLDPDEYEPRNPAERSPVVLGWMGNRHQIPRLRDIGEPLRQLAATREVLVRTVAPERIDLPGVPTESLTHPWSPESERSDLTDLDIGLLPLRDNPHDRGKSPLKLLQYAAAGLPIVASPVGIDLELFRPHEAFLPAQTEREWLEATTRLVDDPALRAQLGRTARDTVVRHYSFKSRAAAFADVLRTAAGVRPGDPARAAVA